MYVQNADQLGKKTSRLESDRKAPRPHERREKRDRVNFICRTQEKRIILLNTIRRKMNRTQGYYLHTTLVSSHISVIQVGFAWEKGYLCTR